MKAPNYNFTYDLYIRNQEVFHAWLKKRYKVIIGHPGTWCCVVVAILIAAIFTISSIKANAEISTYDYGSLQDDLEHYGKDIPEYEPRLIKAMGDGMIVEWEQDELDDLRRAHWRAEEQIKLLKAKKSLSKQIDD